jgi:hypothetical protein
MLTFVMEQHFLIQNCLYGAGKNLLDKYKSQAQWLMLVIPGT